MQLAGIIFDMDGTLLDTERLSSRAWEMTQEQLGIRLPDGFVTSIIGVATHRSQAMMAEVFRSEEKMLSFWSAFAKNYDTLVASGALRLKPGAREILQWAKAKGLRLALATSTRRVVADRKLEMTGLGEFFEHTVCGDEVAGSKPDPEIFLKAVEKLGMEKSELIIIEDSPNGLRAGAASGVRTLLVPDLAPIDPDVRSLAFAEFASLDEVRKWTEDEMSSVAQ